MNNYFNYFKLLSKEDKVYFISSIILFAYFLIRLIDQSKLIFIFPLDTINDISSHMAQLYFLGKCGIHNLCSYWYNGYYLFKIYPPGWFFFAYPFSLIFKNIQLTTYVSLVVLFLINFVSIYSISKLENFSKVRRIFFFLLIFVTPLSISSYIRLGRITELFGWTVFLLIMYFILKYKDKDLGIKAIISLALLYGILLISHPTVIILAHFFILSFVISKINSFKEISKVGLFTGIGLMISSFWWYPFVKELGESRTYDYLPEITERFINLNSQWFSTVILITLAPIIMLIFFCLYAYTNKINKKEIIFYLPILILGVLTFTRIVIFIPYLNYVYPEPHITFYTIFLAYFFLKINFERLNKKMGYFVLFLVLFGSVFSVIISAKETSFFIEHTELEENTLVLLEKVNTNFVILESPSQTSYSKAYYSYGPIYYNISTPSGWSPSEVSKESILILTSLGQLFKNKDCNGFKQIAKEINLKEFITYNEFCDLKCGFKEKIQNKNVCLIRI